jgi:hypothetical protein
MTGCDYDRPLLQKRLAGSRNVRCNQVKTYDACVGEGHRHASLNLQCQLVAFVVADRWAVAGQR